MENLTIVVILVLVAIIFLLSQKIIFQKKIISEKKQQEKKIIVELEKVKLKYDELILEQFTIQNNAYKTGFNDGESKNTLTVRVEPIEKYVGNNYYIWSTEKVEIGFEYTLLINGIASEYKSTHIIKSVKTSKVNQENINAILNGLEQIENLNPKFFLVNKSFKILKDNFLKQINK